MHYLNEKPKIRQMIIVLRQLLGVCLLCCILFLPQGGHAENTVQITECIAQQMPDGLAVSAQINFTPAQRFSSLLKRGIPLHFVTEFSVKRERWYWWDQTVVDAKYEWRLSYHALTRRYRLSNKNQSYNFNTLDEALAIIRNVGHWHVSDKSILSNSSDYQASIRFKLDESQLPKLFQATPMMRLEWRLSSDWQPCRIEVKSD